LGSRRNQWGEEIRDREDPVCQSCSIGIRTVFIIENKILTSREYQEFVVLWEDQVGDRRRPWDVTKYGSQDPGVVASALRQCAYL
jgi:hypothetical protein